MLEEATKLSDQGYDALVAGNSNSAADLFYRAGRLLTDRFPSCKGKEKYEVMMDSAKMFFLAGQYERTKQVLDQIPPAAMTKEIKEIYDKSNQRAVPQYLPCTLSEINGAQVLGDWKGVLDLLADHPYILDPVEMARVRATACQRLGRTALAEEFAADARKLMK